MSTGTLVEDTVLEVLRKAQLDQFINKFVFTFNVRRLDHFSLVKDNAMLEIGMQQQQIRQLREQINKMSREMWNRSDPKQVYVQADQSTPTQSTIDEHAFIPSDAVKLHETLGEGTFAIVKRGIWTNDSRKRVDVAVKILRDISPNVIEELNLEASHLLKLHHPSLINLFGIVRQPAMMVFELCEGGSVLDRLRDESEPVLVGTLVQWLQQVASGLQFLESKHCVHRDIAARNLLLSKDFRNVKICDFGLMRALKDNEQMYTMGPQKKIPFAWSPQEALRHRKFSSKSDVYSFGVVIWEFFTYGEEPWIGCRAIDVLKHLDAGETLDKPKYSSDRIFQIMKNCWKLNPAERCTFAQIRQDLQAAQFKKACVREPCHSIQPGTLQLNKGDNIELINENGDDWFGQCHRTRKFGTFPRSVVFVEYDNFFIAPAPSVQPVFRAPPKETTPAITVPILPKPLNNNTISAPNDRASRISMPVAGSFIHTGHGDPLGGESWGNPGSIDQMYLKNPVKGVPLSRTSNGAVVIDSKTQLTNGGMSTHTPAAQATGPSTSFQSATLNLNFDNLDDFDRAFEEEFSPSRIDLPTEHPPYSNNYPSTSQPDPFEYNRSIWTDFPSESGTQIAGPSTSFQATPQPLVPTSYRDNSIPQRSEMEERRDRVAQELMMHRGGRDGLLKTVPVAAPLPTSAWMDSPRSINSAGNLSTPYIPPTKTNGNLPSNLMPELRSRLENNSGMRPRPASSIGVQINEANAVVNNAYRPTSVVNLPTAPVHQPPTTIPCLVPTPAPAPVSAPPTVRAPINQPNTLQRQLADELRGNLNKRPTQTTEPVRTQRVQETPVERPRPVLNYNYNQPRDQPPAAPVHSVKPQPARAEIPGTSVRPEPTPAVSMRPNPVAAQPTPAKQDSVKAPVASTSSVTRRVTPPPTERSGQSEEDRRSKIIQEMSSVLPPPSSLLFGSSSSTSNLPSTSNGSPAPNVSSVPNGLSSSAVRERPAAIVPSKPQPTMPPKKTSEPILSREVLQPTPLNSGSASSIPSQPVRNVSPPVVSKPTPKVVEKKDVAPALNTNVPLYNLTNSSSMYPSLNGQQVYGNSTFYGYQPQPYGYGMNHGGYHGYPSYNPYASGMGQLALAHSAANSLPPLVPSENHLSGVTQPLRESDIHDFLPNQHRAPVAASSAPSQSNVSHQPPQTNSTTTATGDLSMAEKMEILYKEAHFMERGKVDTMVRQTSGNTELALKNLKEIHLVDMGIASNTNAARCALEATRYDLDAAANQLLG